ncbi:MAG: histidinol dehydrogenase [Bacteroides sp.]|nr:histidinol dehydrogenase [Bacteroides sp.]
MKVIKYPTPDQWDDLLKRPEIESGNLFAQVQTILNEVKSRGDDALYEFNLKFDKIKLDSLLVKEEELQEANTLVSSALKEAIKVAYQNIYKFHSSQQVEEKKVETMAGVTCWRKAIPIEKVGLYIPGGTAPLFSTVLMLAIPAKIAGCNEIILCTPPNTSGKIAPAILYAAQVAGVNKIYKVGGAQAIGAMAYGTESIPKVYKIFGPGNQYVTAAKQLVSLKNVAIDMPAGPSEVAVLADESANPIFVAADLLSQAEHGIDSQVLLVTTHETLIQEVEEEIDKQLKNLPRRELTEKTLLNSKIILVQSIEEGMDIINSYAPEHLIVEVKNHHEVAKLVINAGSVFLGSYTPESAGDYASGTNHTLPTNGHARAYSGVSLDSFVRKTTFQEITQEGLQKLGPTIEVLAQNELLDAHKNAVTLRLKTLQKNKK